MAESASEKKKEDWMNSKWRPMMGWMYMLVCFMDFVGFPVLWSLIQAYDHGNVTSQWQPLTLQGAGLFHLAMGAVIGISAYGRTQEKLNGAEGGGLGSFGPGAGTTYVPPTGNTSVMVSNQAPASTNFGGTTNVTNTSFGGPATSSFAPAGGGFASAPSPSGFGSAPSPSGSTPPPSNFGNTTTGNGTNGGFGSGFNSGATPPTTTTQIAQGFGGKKAPPPQNDPEI